MLNQGLDFEESNHGNSRPCMLWFYIGKKNYRASLVGLIFKTDFIYLLASKHFPPLHTITYSSTAAKGLKG